MSDKIRHWILVGDAYKVNVFSSIITKSSTLKLINNFEDPLSRIKNSELISDGPGHAKNNRSSATSYSEKKSPHIIEEEKFAIKIASFLNKEFAIKSFNKLVIVAPHILVSMIKKHLSKQVLMSIEHIIYKDYTKLNTSDLNNIIKRTVKPILF